MCGKTINERELWNRKYAEGTHLNSTPDPFLIDAYESFVEPVLGPEITSSGSLSGALDIAGGTGRHAIWLARRGWKVHILDISPVGLNLAQTNANTASVAITTEARNVAEEGLSADQYDLVLVFFYLERALFPAIQAAVRPGGLLIYKTYTCEHPCLSGGRGPGNPSHLLESNELLGVFSTMQILHYRETLKEKGVAELVARKKDTSMSPLPKESGS